MGTAHHHRVPVLDGFVSDNFDETQKLGTEQVAGFCYLQSETGINDIRAGESKVNEASGVACRFARGAEESDHIVIGFMFDFAHTLNRARSSSNRSHRPIRNLPSPMPGFANGLLDREPSGDLPLVAPDRTHFGSGVATDQRPNPLLR